MRWGVHLEIVGHKWIEIEADTAEQAREIGLDIGVKTDIGEFTDNTEVIVADVVLDDE